MTEKTYKQKCLEMWEWLAENPTKNKNDYAEYLASKGMLLEYRLCWACQYVNDFTETGCCSCPINWNPKVNEKINCLSRYSPYAKWEHSNRFTQKKEAAEKIVKLIKETWKE